MLTNFKKNSPQEPQTSAPPPSSAKRRKYEHISADMKAEVVRNVFYEKVQHLIFLGHQYLVFVSKNYNELKNLLLSKYQRREDAIHHLTLNISFSYWIS